MSTAAIYTPLSDKERSEQENTAGDRSETPLLDEGGLFSDKKRGNLRRYGYWIVYFGSVIAMSRLLVRIQQSLQNNRRECWDMFNYYYCVDDGDDQEKATVDEIGPQAAHIHRAISDVDRFGQGAELFSVQE
ncbi:hypothetical protein OEA41_002324 [Lepraria neglecta]|uniref:Uncharacterized protein n=1 Tax=Lepraria neglecta TaxID=209136 RepID=A0AAD9ZEL8_9LECA|nr:hypothetical protein OEA41_002324 [Lepraria neglecta]